jgi:hypothetical protein
MLRATMVLMSLVVLVSCGADGAPTAPTTTGMSVTGTAEAGVAKAG